MNELLKWTVLLALMRIIEGPQLDPTSITCYVCSSQNKKDCGDPMRENVKQSIPFFECNRLYGVFDDQHVEYVHFRPTNHGKVKENSTITIDKNTTTTNAPKIGNQTASRSDELGGMLETTDINGLTVTIRFRRRRSYPQSIDSEYEYPSHVLENDSEVGTGFWNVFSIINSQLWPKEQRIHRRVHEYAKKESGYEFEFFPFRTQRGPTGIEERPQHFCYKLIFKDEPHEVVQRGCTNVTTKSNACNYYLKTFPNVSKCEFCGLNFCNGNQRTMTVETLQIIIGEFVAFSLIFNTIISV